MNRGYEPRNADGFEKLEKVKEMDSPREPEKESNPANS